VLFFFLCVLSIPKKKKTFTPINPLVSSSLTIPQNTGFELQFSTEYIPQTKY
jgi:hypothetical protein